MTAIASPRGPGAVAGRVTEKLEHKHRDKYPTVIRTFRGRWEQFVPFLSYPQEIRRMLYTTNALESLNSQLRKMLRSIRSVRPVPDS